MLHTFTSKIYEQTRGHIVCLQIIDSLREMRIIQYGNRLQLNHDFALHKEIHPSRSYVNSFIENCQYPKPADILPPEIRCQE